MSIDPKDKSRKSAIARLRQRSKQRLDISALAEGILSGNLTALSFGITLCESQRPQDQVKAAELLSRCSNHAGKSIRVGITGVPGVGKSTFIEAFGEDLITAGHRVAVLAIDPSSQLNRGSILGDKTRMERLSKNNDAFIRPSAANSALGGVAARTREAILLCEAAGFDRILVETVGVGQSEIEVRDMVDYFMLLMLAGAGDELQGIKRGIMEMADALVITKVDGENQNASKRAKKEYQNALHLFPPSDKDWIVKVFLTSALDGIGLEHVQENLNEFILKMSESKWLNKNRKQQETVWFDKLLREKALELLRSQLNLGTKIDHLQQQVSAGLIHPHVAINELGKSING